MQQIFSILFKNSYKLLFLLLIGISFFLTVQSHSYHKSRVISSANFLTGSVYEKMNNVESYFNLKVQNEELAQENARLKLLLFNKKDSVLIDKDSVFGVKKVNIILSKVVHNSYNFPKNYLTINTGSKSGIKQDMGVVNDLGIVGIIDKTSENYATVQSILNLNSRINAKIKNANHFGTLVWDAKSTGFVQLIDVPRLASVRKGDTIVTGGESEIFPENVNIGKIDKIYIDNKTHYFTLSIKLFNDMTNLGHVYIIKSKDREEVVKLEAQIKNE
jgi:rod shape-determining protein MreC